MLKRNTSREGKNNSVSSSESDPQSLNEESALQAINQKQTMDEYEKINQSGEQPNQNTDRSYKKTDAHPLVDNQKGSTKNFSTINSSFDIEAGEEKYQLRPFKFNLKTLLSFVGPGFLMSIAYLDPGNIAGDLEAGIKGGYSLIWTLLWATSLGLFYQSMSARLGVVTQRDLAKLCAEQFTKKTRYILWIMTELAIIGADIQEVVGSATALQILFGTPLWAGALITILDSFLFLFIHYFGIRKLEAFFAFLISIMVVCFFANLFTAKPDVGDLIYGTIVPTVPAGALPATLGLIGAVIMPHNLFLHSSLVLTRKINMKDKNQVRDACIYNNIESACSLLVSFLISASVIATFAVYTKSSQYDGGEVDLNSASRALEKTFGENSKYIWAVGLLAAGQSSTMSGTYAGQFVMEGFLELKLPIYQRVMITRSVAIVPALCVSLISEGALTRLDVGLNILQSVQLPFAIVPLIKFVSNEKIMGTFVVPKKQVIFASCFGFFLFSMNFVILFTQFGETLHESPFLLLLVIAASVTYLGFIFTAVTEPVTQLKQMTKEEMEDHEYDRVVVDELTDETFPSTST